MNKGEVRTHFKSLLNRSDCTDALADTFIEQGQIRVQRMLRIPSQEKQRTYSIESTTGIAALFLPNDLLEMLTVYYDGRALTGVPLHEMVEMQKTGQTGAPRHFCRQRNQILLHPQPTSGDVVMDYFSDFAELTDDSSTNGLTLAGADLLIYTALSYAADYFLDERGPLFETRAAQFLTEIQSQADDAALSGVNQTIRPTHTYEDY